MKFVFDFDKLEKYNLTKEEAFYLLMKGFDMNSTEEDIITTLNEKGFLYMDYLPEDKEFVFTLSINGAEQIKQFLLDSEITQEVSGKDRFELLAEKLRELFPTGKKDGTNYYWRDSIKIIANKLRGLKKVYNAEFTDEEAIEATKKYVESFNGNYTYMQLLKYFISKREIKNGELVESSQLLSYIENKGDVEMQRNDWINTLK